MPGSIPAPVKKEISRLRSQVRKIEKDFADSKKLRKDVNPFTGIVSGNYWTQTGMPWVSGEGRKAVLTEYFWQPIRGQPRRVDTNELRQFSQDHWVNACVNIILSEISSLDWDIIPKDEVEYAWVEEEIKLQKEFLLHPNKNGEGFGDLIRALLKDVLEIDAGIIVKVFDIDSYDFEDIEPKSGAPMLKPIGQRRMTEIYVRDGASFLKEIDKFGFEKGFWQYSYQIPAHPMWFNKEEIVYVMEHQRSMSCYGFARTQSILDIIKSLHYSTLYNKKFFEETTIPDGALALLDTNEAEMTAFRNWWNGEFRAQPHKMAIMNKDMKWMPFNVTNKELEFLDTQKWYFNMVISAYGLSPTELGLTEDANRATSATQAELVKRKSIRPLLRILEDAINHGVLSEFGFEGTEFQFIYDDPAEKKQRLDNWNLELSMGVKTVNEVRNEMGFEPIEGGDVGNNYLSRLSQGVAQAQPGQAAQGAGLDEADQAEGTDGAEGREAPGYEEARDREEGEEGDAKGVAVGGKGEETTGKDVSRENQDQADRKAKIHQPYSDSVRPTTVKSLSREELIAEHARLVTVLESGSEEERKAEAVRQKRELEQYLSERKKGVDDGQYYRDQPISQPRRPSGADFQPQNPRPSSRFQPDGGLRNRPRQAGSGMQPVRRREPDTALPTPWNQGSQPHSDVNPSHLGDSQGKPGVDVWESVKDHINCPVCGMAALTVLNSMEQIPEDIRCTNCGSRFRSSELLENQVNGEAARVLEANNDSKPVSIPDRLKPKSFLQKNTDDDLDLGKYTGVDLAKAMPYAVSYADSEAYKRLLSKFLKDLPEPDRVKIAAIIKQALKTGSSVRETARKIEGVVKDAERARIIARTETVRVANEGNIAQAEDRGVKKMEWLSAKEDGRLCEKCAARNGVIYSVSEVKGKIPLHPACRCTLLEA